MWVTGRQVSSSRVPVRRRAERLSSSDDDGRSLPTGGYPVMHRWRERANRACGFEL
jgi:hypothetical protein